MEDTLGDKKMSKKENVCPYCKEEIKPDAIKCKHCSSIIGKEMPSHEGICPFCKESINPDAIKCKHCKTSLFTDSDCGCNGVNGSEQAITLKNNTGRFAVTRDWYCWDGTMNCRLSDGSWIPCGSCEGGWHDPDKLPSFSHGRLVVSR